MPYVTFVPQAPMGESADPGIFVQGTHVPAPLVERSGIWIKTAGSAILLQQNYRLSTCDAPLWLVVDDGRIVREGTHRELLKSCPLYREIAELQLGEEALKNEN